MGALPKKKHTVHRQGRRRATIKLTMKQLVVCGKCQEKKIAHTECPNCGSTR